MKRGFLVLVLILLVLLIAYSIITDFPVFNRENGFAETGEVITGNATSAGISLTITISGPPTLTLLKSENETYFTATNLELNFTAFSADSIWYKIDSGSNVTITGNTTFNTTSGQHTLYLFANNSDGNSSKNVTFRVNTTKFNVLYDIYKNNGSSTDFNASSYEDIQNLSGAVIEKTGHGKVSFNQAINLTNDSNPGDNALDLDSYTNISQNHIEINTTAIPNFNKSATLSIYGLSFSDPRVLRDGSVCPSEICTEINYSGGTFMFNVTQFTAYSAEETPASQSPSGGGGGGTAGVSGFVVNPDEIQVILKQGGTKKATLKITNTGTRKLEIKLEEKKLGTFLKIGNTSFSLNSGETQEILLDFIAREDAIPGLYIGGITVKAGGAEKEIILALSIQSRESLFDVEVNIPSGYTTVIPGEDVLADVKIYNLGAIERVDAEVKYEIRDEENNSIKIISDTVAVETQASFTKTINIPESTALGTYVLYVTVTYGGKVAGAGVFFEVAEQGVSAREKVFIVVITLLAVISSIAVYLWVLHYRKEHRKYGETGYEDRRIDLRDVLIGQRE
ncbi:MAG: hypothetical protein AABX79_02570 [Nanoarchaeota archaeon]